MTAVHLCVEHQTELVFQMDQLTLTCSVSYYSSHTGFIDEYIMNFHTEKLNYFSIFCFQTTDPPKAIVSVNRIITNQSDVIKVNCHVTGNPKPSIKWTKMENLSQVLSLENTLALNVTGKIDEGRYQCQAKNGVGNSSHDVATVLVQSKYSVYCAYSK